MKTEMIIEPFNEYTKVTMESGEVIIFNEDEMEAIQGYLTSSQLITLEEQYLEPAHDSEEAIRADVASMIYRDEKAV